MSSYLEPKTDQLEDTLDGKNSCEHPVPIHQYISVLLWRIMILKETVTNERSISKHLNLIYANYIHHQDNCIQHNNEHDKIFERGRCDSTPHSKLQ